MRNKVFICYSHKDKEFLDRLKIHLKPLEKNNLIDLWSDQKIKNGDEWQKAIEAALLEAKIAILLISADFLASDFIVDNELPRILDKSAKNELKIIQVIIKPCSFLSNKSLSKYQAVNDPQKPLAGLSIVERENIWAGIYKEIEDLSLELLDKERVNYGKAQIGENNVSVNPTLNEQKYIKSAPINKIETYIEDGIGTNTKGDTIITIAPTVFFDYRISGAFPGIRGLKWFDKPQDALERLEILLRYPIEFKHAPGHGVSRTPFFYFRGHAALNIINFQILSGTRFLINWEEMELDRMYVFRSKYYWQSYIYIEIKADKPTGVYTITQSDINDMIEKLGYADEEYGLFKNEFISRECYDDGAAIINGIITDTRDAVLRRRYLSRYNFILTSQYSPINLSKFDAISEPILNDILQGKNRFDELHENIIKLSRNELDD